MKQKHTLDPKKAVEALLYVAQRVPDIYTALKVLYFADKEHLAKYGRLICGDSYVAMQHGPVPSVAYDIVKCARGERLPLAGLSISRTFSVQGNNLVPRREPNLDLLSESDIECLGDAIKEFGHLSFTKLRRLSHDAAFKSADKNDFISLEAIAGSLPDGKLLADYLQNG